MRAYIVKPGTPIKAVAPNTEFSYNNFIDTTTTKELMFFTEDIRIDPLGNVGVGPQYRSTIGGAIAKNGYYGFEDEATGYIAIVHASHVQIV